MQQGTVTTLVLVAGMLITGSVNTISKKVGYDTCSVGLGGVDAASDTMTGCPDGDRKFRKPWTQTLVMFCGESMCLFLFWYNRTKSRPHEQRDSRGQLATTSTTAFSLPRPGHRDVQLKSVLVCLLPALCDLGGTTLSGIGLLFTPASIFQMLRGSIIIFTALFSILFLKRKVHGFQWMGIAVTVVGITLVGVSSYLGSSSDDDTSTGLVMAGNGLVILSQTLSAFQMVVEEKYLKKLSLPPEFVVGCEGLFGAVMMLAIVLPLVYHIPFKSCGSDWCLDGNGVHEDALDAAELVSNSGLLLSVVLLYWVSIAFYNFCGLAVAKSLSSVHRTLIDACRTVVVWTVSIILYYSTDGRYGEKWDTLPGMIQLFGFSMMVTGTCIHNKVIRVPWCWYPPLQDPLLASQSRSDEVAMTEPRDEKE